MIYTQFKGDLELERGVNMRLMMILLVKVQKSQFQVQLSAHFKRNLVINLRIHYHLLRIHSRPIEQVIMTTVLITLTVWRLVSVGFSVQHRSTKKLMEEEYSVQVHQSLMDMKVVRVCCLESQEQ
jgi:hypothetical protein